MDIGVNDFGVDGYRTVIHNRYYNIQGHKYWVEISFNPQKLAFVILRRVTKSKQNYLVAILPMKVAEKLLKEDRNEADVFVRRVSI